MLVCSWRAGVRVGPFSSLYIGLSVSICSEDENTELAMLLYIKTHDSAQANVQCKGAELLARKPINERYQRPRVYAKAFSPYSHTPLEHRSIMSTYQESSRKMFV